jgi:hypothetical protein
MDTRGRRNVNKQIHLDRDQGWAVGDMEVSFGVTLNARDVCFRKRNA